MSTPAIERFDQLGLSAPLLSALEAVGYETPSPIQAACIPVLLEGHDLLGEAQTGTGKTAAFALPILERIELSKRKPQALILTPTRELAIQVAEALQKYARHLPDFHVLPVYGGQSMVVQLRQLERGAHVIVGTPGRVMDHLERKSLSLDGLKTLVLDEADEMLRMGFIDDVEWILEHTPATRQTALFSATMPDAIRRVAHHHLREPKEVKIKSATTTVTAIRQRYWMIAGLNKVDALTRMLEVEEQFDAAIIFVRTKIATVELAEKLEARGYAAAALNGDMQQPQRERTIEQLKNGRLDIVVATDVAARGIDVPRVSHVINYDIPYDSEAYVHRIGRTGRAGRTGNAILFISAREKYMLRVIEKATRSPIEPMQLPTEEAVTRRRVSQFKQTVVDALAEDGLDFYEDVVRQIEREHNVETRDVAAALAWLAQKEKPLVQEGQRVRTQRTDERAERSERVERPSREERPARPAPAPRAKPERAPAAAPVARPAAATDFVAAPDVAPGPGADPNDPWAEAREAKRLRKEAERAAKAEQAALAPKLSPWAKDRPERAERPARTEGSERPSREDRPARPEQSGNVRYRIAIGRDNGVMPKDIVGAIANEAGIESRFIGQINLFDDFSTVELPGNLSAEVYDVLQRIRIKGKPIGISPDSGDLPMGTRPPRRPREFGDERPREERPRPARAWDDRPPRSGEGRPAPAPRKPRADFGGTKAPVRRRTER